MCIICVIYLLSSIFKVLCAIILLTNRQYMY